MCEDLNSNPKHTSKKPSMVIPVLGGDQVDPWSPLASQPSLISEPQKIRWMAPETWHLWLTSVLHNVNTHTETHTGTHAYVHTHTHVHIHPHTCIYPYKHTRTPPCTQDNYHHKKLRVGTSGRAGSRYSGLYINSLSPSPKSNSAHDGFTNRQVLSTG